MIQTVENRSNGAVHSFDLPVGPWMVRFGEPVLDTVVAADLVEAVDAHARSPAITVLWKVSELDAIAHWEGSVRELGTSINCAIEQVGSGLGLASAEASLNG